MQAFVIDRYGKNVPLRSASVPEPAVGPDDVLVQVHAAGVNPLDAKIRDGEFKLILPYRLPLVLGNDVAGVVTRVGSRVRRFKAGDEVYARPAKDRIGTFAEFIAMHQDDVAIKPQRLTMEEAASLPLIGLTAWQALVEKANLQKGQKVFIQAGSGGVGATTASAANIELMKELGADVVIDYKSQDFEKVLSGYDVVLNSQDARTLEKSIRVLRPGGRLISISGPPDPEFGKEMAAPGFLRLAMRLLSAGVRRRARARGVAYSFLFMKPSGKQLEAIAQLVDAGAIRPVIDKVFPFAATNEAVAYVDSGRVKGKVIVRMA
jgi:NADPH:quinone reductase-like Zn-dependent oxidoreductase